MLIEKCNLKKVNEAFFIGGSKLIKGGEAVFESSFNRGWTVLNSYLLLNKYYILLLENQNTKSNAVWFFDEHHNFFCNDFKSPKLRDSIRNEVNIFLDGLLSLDLYDDYNKAVEEIHNSPSFIRRNLYLLVRETVADIKASSEVSFDDLLSFFEINDSEKNLQDVTIKSSKLEVNLEGKLLSTNKSIIINDHIISYLFRDDNKVFFVFFHGNNSEPCLFYWPKNQTVIFNNCKPSIYIPLLRQQFISNFFNIQKYIENEAKSKVVGLIRSNHIGHHLWNDLTGVNRITNKKLDSNLTEIIIHDPSRTEHYGKVDYLFDLKCGVNRDLSGLANIANHVYENNFLLVRITDDYISGDLAKKILRKCASYKSDKFNKVKNNIKVVLGLRLENRTWINQKEGLKRLLNALCKRFGEHNFVFIVDGHNKLHNGAKIMSYQERPEDDIQKKEFEILNYLKEHCVQANSEVVSCLGSSLGDNLSSINSADFFIAPWGAGLVKYKWICNLPGVVFTSQYNLKHRADLDIYDSTEFREGVVPSEYLEVEAIEDIYTLNAEPNRANFFLSEDILIDSVISYIEKIV